MKTLKQHFQEAMDGKWAIGHFNFSTAEQLRAIAEASMEAKVPVMVGTSEGEAGFLGRVQSVALVGAWRMLGYDLHLNADHHKSWISAKEAIDSGYDTILIDASKMPYEENIELTKKVVVYARKMSREHGVDITVEGEIGYLKGESQVQENVEISSEDYTKPEQAKDFIARTGVDRLAIVFGNIHGIVTKQEEHLDIGVLKRISETVPGVPLVLHGGSGLADSEVKEAIANGISNVHINTELRVAYQKALKAELKKEPDQTTPYKLLTPSYEATKKVVLEKLKLFSGK